MKKTTFTLAGSIALMMLTGCALTPETIALGYKQAPGVVQLKGAGNISVKVAVADMRQDKTRVGSKKNAYGMELAPILAAEDVAVTVRKAMESELQARGFKVGSQEALVQIAADLTRFYNNHKIGFPSSEAVAELNMLVSLKAKNGSPLYSRQITGNGTEPRVHMLTGDNAKLALDRALENGIKILFDDAAFIAALLAAK